MGVQHNCPAPIMNYALYFTYSITQFPDTLVMTQAHIYQLTLLLSLQFLATLSLRIPILSLILHRYFFSMRLWTLRLSPSGSGEEGAETVVVGDEGGIGAITGFVSND